MTYGSGTGTVINSTTGDNNIDGLLTHRKWESNTVTYSFTNQFENDYEDELNYPNHSVHSNSFVALNDIQQDVARQWMDQYESVSNLNLIELTGDHTQDAVLRIAQSNHPNTAYAYFPYKSVQAGDIWFNNIYYNNPVIGNYAYHTFGHEIGHALGLAHGHEETGIHGTATDHDRDSMEFSIMTYRAYEGQEPQDYDQNGSVEFYYNNELSGYAQSLMMYDIAAIQHMYGANFTSNASDTTYTFSTTTGEMFIDGVGQGQPGDNRIFRTIWDGDGNDTYDFSNYTTHLSIDLTPGMWSDLDTSGNFQRAYLGEGHYARGQIFNALLFQDDSRSLIENAIGGSGSDYIQGNVAHNILNGNHGDDTIHGGLGHDQLKGGRGQDTLHGGQGNDHLYGGRHQDTLYGDDGNDSLWGGKGIDVLSGNSGNDHLYGEKGNDTLIGGSGNDILLGGKGDDVLNGTSYAAKGIGEKDILFGGSGHDQDIFILGEKQNEVGHVFYADQGHHDYALIRNFDLYILANDLADRIQLLGSAESYSITNVSVDDITGAGIHVSNDLIAIVDSMNADVLNLYDSNQFIYI